LPERVLLLGQLRPEPGGRGTWHNRLWLQRPFGYVIYMRFQKYLRDYYW
jgi:hypothetical protein